MDANLDYEYVPTSASAESAAHQIVVCVNQDEVLATNSSISFTFFCFEETRTTPLYVVFNEPARSLISLQAIAEQTQFSVSQFAQIFDVSRPTIYKWMKNESEIQPNNAKKIGILVEFINSFPDEVLPIIARITNRKLSNGKDVLHILRSVQSGMNDKEQAIQEISAIAAEWVARSENYKSRPSSSLRLFSESNIGRVG